MKKPKFIIQKSSDGQFYFVLRAVNGEIICTSEMYQTQQACVVGINSVISCSCDAVVVRYSDISDKKLNL